MILPQHRERVIRKSIVLLLFLGAITWAATSYRGLPAPVAIALALAVILSWALDNTVWGRHVYAVGSSREASRIAGVRVRRQVVFSFVLIGLLTGLAAVIFVGRIGSAPPQAGLFLELDAIAAVVIGGASLYGGTGRVSGVLLGALLTQSLLNGLSLLNVQTAYQYITSGVVLMLAVFLDALSKRGGRIVVRM
jgi:D-xylose transport system permease protein